MVRGGCWNSKPDYCRAAYRYYEMPAYTDTCFAKDLHGQIGFRCVRKRPALRQTSRMNRRLRPLSAVQQSRPHKKKDPRTLPRAG